MSGLSGFIEAWEPPKRSEVHTYHQVGDMKADIKETYRLPADDEPDLSIGFSGEAALRGPYSGQLVMSRPTVRVHVSVLSIRRR